MANSFQKDIYGRSTWKVETYWDKEFVQRDPQFHDLAEDLKRKFKNVEKVIDDLSDDLMEEIIKDISNFMNYPCSAYGNRNTNEKPDFASLETINETIKSWHNLVEQLLIKQQSEGGRFQLAFQPERSKGERFDYLNQFLTSNNFKTDKFLIPYPSNESLTVTLYQNSPHRFYVHPCSPSTFFVFGKISLDDYELFSFAYKFEVSWSEVLACFLIWLDGVAEVNSLKTDGIVNTLRSLLSKGENMHLEFKSTLYYDLKEQQRKYHIEHSVLKTIAAFLNSNGGTLLIGVRDDGSIHGLDDDFKVLGRHGDPRDGFNKAFDNLINNNFGPDIHPSIHLSIESIESKFIAKVVVPKRAQRPVLLIHKEKNSLEEFYVRQNASSVSLSIGNASSYIIEHWRRQ